jgi:hypothetical protein
MFRFNVLLNVLRRRPILAAGPSIITSLFLITIISVALRTSVGGFKMQRRKRGKDVQPGARKRARKPDAAKEATARRAVDRRVAKAASDKAAVAQLASRESEAAKQQFIHSMRPTACVLSSDVLGVASVAALAPDSTASDSAAAVVLAPMHSDAPMHSMPDHQAQADAPAPEPAPAPAPELEPRRQPEPTTEPVPNTQPALAPQPEAVPTDGASGESDSNPAECGACEDVDCDDLGDDGLDESLKEDGVVHKYLWHIRRQLQWEDTGHWASDDPEPTKRLVVDEGKEAPR